MPLRPRPDGRPVADLPTLRRFMPYLMPGRNESAVYLSQTIRLERTEAWLEAREAAGEPAKLYDVLLAALVQVLSERPRLNRFIVGRKVYERDDIALGFAVKKRFEDDAPLSTVKLSVAPGADFDAVRAAVREAVGVGKGEEATVSEKEMRVVAALPGPLLRLVLWAQRQLDALGLLPRAMIDSDPLYASAFIANLGSVGLDAPFHHLFEYGTVPIFVTVGRVHDAPVVEPGPDGTPQLAVGRVVEVRYTYDERVADGFYCAKAVQRFGELVADPAGWASAGDPG